MSILIDFYTREIDLESISKQLGSTQGGGCILGHEELPEGLQKIVQSIYRPLVNQFEEA